MSRRNVLVVIFNPNQKEFYWPRSGFFVVPTLVGGGGLSECAKPDLNWRWAPSASPHALDELLFSCWAGYKFIDFRAPSVAVWAANLLIFDRTLTAI